MTCLLASTACTAGPCHERRRSRVLRLAVPSADSFSTPEAEHAVILASTPMAERLVRKETLELLQNALATPFLWLCGGHVVAWRDDSAGACER